MQFKLSVTEDAENDVEAAMDWYENKQEGLGTKYVLTIRVSLHLIAINPFAYARVHLKIRKANTQKFPYSLYYEINDKEVIIFAIIHNSRSDKIWKKRI